MRSAARNRRLYCLVAGMVVSGLIAAGRAPAADAPAAGDGNRPAAETQPTQSWPFPSAGLTGAALEKARLDSAASWLNARPLFTPAEDPSGQRGIVSLEPYLEGKAVLLHFWDYTNAHCLAMVPLLEAWHERYAREGLVIVGVHAPEFAFSSRAENVNEAVRRSGISYPVYLDSDFLLWRIFVNQHWPRTILIAPGGSVAHDAVGSAETQATEAAIRSVLGETRGRKFTDPLLPPLPHDRKDARCHPDTADTFCGFERGRLGAPGYRKDGTATDYHIPPHAEVRQDEAIYLEGRWQATSQALFPAGAGPWELRLRYKGVGVALVSQPPPGVTGARVRVTLDEKPVPPPFRGEDLSEGAGGETYFTLTTPRLVRLVARAPFAAHEIALFPEKAQTGFYVFYFDGCE